MENRIITFDSLIEYCKANNIQKFSSKETGKPIIVSTFGNMDIAKPNKFSEADSSLMPITMKACHTGINRNNSKISETTMAKALPSFMNKPILAEIKDGDFGSHAMEYVEDNNGNFFVRYIERAVGIVPESCNAHLEYDKEKDKMYTIVDGYIFNYYGNETAEILKKKNGTKVSVEIEVNEFEWSQDDNCLEILDFTFSGVTLLGEDIAEGMEGSRLDLSKLPTAELNYSAQLIEMQEKLDVLINCINNKDSEGKEETFVEDTKNEVTETVEEVIEETTDEVVEETSEETPETDEVETTEETVTETMELEGEAGETEETTEEVVEETENETAENEYELLKAEYEEYKNTHSHTNEEYEELKKYRDDAEFEKTHAERENILADDKYSVLSENEAFAELKKNIDNYSLADLEKEAKVIFADHVASVGTFSYAGKDNKVSKITFNKKETKSKEKSKAYSTLFK